MSQYKGEVMKFFLKIFKGPLSLSMFESTINRVVKLSGGILCLSHPTERERKRLGWELIIKGTISEFQLTDLNITE
jgi:hypothetical protein